ncbi:rhomboid family intramembrane serine protease [Ulvibacterium sp.]|uniref:rhomboid family intramembrane serine protease n=1 Tax=Ulvibacterium sp. TaxID=2665914 RepID=UPI00260848AF|nr:rhomboid family intramembrane serine protease [Ulvibacterium sp.]
MIPLTDTAPVKSFSWMNWAIIGLNICVYLLQASLTESQLVELMQFFGVVPIQFSETLGTGSYEQLPILGLSLLSSQFLHGGLGHLIGNMWTLYIFGDNIEDRMGSWRYLLFYLICGALAGVIHIFFNIDSAIPTIGASGAISGVMGAYMVLYPRSKIVFLIPWIIPIVYVPSFIYLSFWFFGQFISGSRQILTEPTEGGIAFWAHIGGFIAGILIHWLFVGKKSRGYLHEYPYYRKL